MPTSNPAWRPFERPPVNRSDGQAVDNGPGGGNIARTAHSPWGERLLMLHRQARSAVAKADRAGNRAKNAKGEDVKRIDLVAASSRELCDEIVDVLSHGRH